MVDKYLSWKSKLFSIILGGLFLLQIVLVHNCAADCFYIYGNMSADLVAEQTFSYQISGTVVDFRYRHYHPSEYTSITNIQENTSSSIAFSDNYTTQNTDVDQFGNNYTDYTWDNLSNPHDLVIIITEHATTSAQLGPFPSSDLFPVNQGSIPADVQTYQQSTTLVQANNSSIQAQANAEVQGCTHQYQAVENIIKWIMDAVEYDSSVSSADSDALYTFNQGKGVCMGFSHLACAMLRAVNIPARYVSGISFDRSYNYSFGSYTYSTSWNDGLHAWIEVYYPESGCWIPYDAQRDIHHIDVFRMKKRHGRDKNDFSTILCHYPSYSPEPSITAAAPILNLSMQNDVVNIGVSNKTSDVTETALSVEVTAGASSSLSPPLLDPLTTPTYEKNIIITGTAEAGSTVEIFLNNNSKGTTVAAQNGNFSLAATLANGTNEINAQASLGGDFSNLSQTKYIILKTQSQGSGSSSGLYGGGLYGGGLYGGGLYGGGLFGGGLYGGGLFGGGFGGNLFGGGFGGGLYGGGFGGGYGGNLFGGGFGGNLFGGGFGGGFGGNLFGGGLYSGGFGGNLFGGGFGGGFGGNLFGGGFGGGFGGNLFGGGFGGGFGGNLFGGGFGGGFGGNLFGGGFGGGLFDGGLYGGGFPF